MIIKQYNAQTGQWTDIIKTEEEILTEIGLESNLIESTQEASTEQRLALLEEELRATKILLGLE